MAAPGGVVISFIAKADKAARDIAVFTKKLVGLDTEADQVDRSLTDMQRELDDTGRAARDSVHDLDKADNALADVGDEAGRTADTLRREAAKMSNAIRDAGTGVDREAGGLRDNLKETGSEAGAEFIGNIAEGIGSGQANLNDVIQGTLGGVTNLAASLGGPIGLAAAGIAAGVGIIFQKMNQEAEKTKQKVQDLLGVLDDLGDTTSAKAQQAVWEAWIESIKETPDQLDLIRDGVDRIGISQADFQGAIVGSKDALVGVNQQLDAAEANIQAQANQTGGLTKKQQEQLNQVKAIRDQINGQNSALGETQDIYDDIGFLTQGAKNTTDDWAHSMSGVHDEAKGVNNELDKADGRFVDVNLRIKQGATMGEILAGYSAGAMTTAAAQPIVVNVDARGSVAPTNPRELIALLEGHRVRMGRAPDAVRARAW